VEVPIERWNDILDSLIHSRERRATKLANSTTATRITQGTGIYAVGRRHVDQARDRDLGSSAGRI
jgi:hypothetical protein